MLSFLNIIFNMLIMILLLSVLILVHELGHFISAKLCNVRVTRFAIGMPFGPSWKLFTWQKTDFYIHACLFGGYVAFPDDEQEFDEKKNNEAKQKLIKNIEEFSNKFNIKFLLKLSEKLKKELNEETIKEERPEEQIPQEELYETKNFYQKLLIVSAGVIMNVITAILIVVACALYYHKLPAANQYVYFEGFSKNPCSTINNFDLKDGDKFEKINGREIKSYYSYLFFFKNSKTFDGYAQNDLISKNKLLIKQLNPDLKDDEMIKKGRIIYLPNLSREKSLNPTSNMLKGLEKYQEKGLKLNSNQIKLRNEIYFKNTDFDLFDMLNYSYSLKYLTKLQKENILKNKIVADLINKESRLNLEKSYEIPFDVTLSDLAIITSDTFKPLDIVFKRNNETIFSNDVTMFYQNKIGTYYIVKEDENKINSIPQAIKQSFNYIYTTTKTMMIGLWQLFRGKVAMDDMHGVIAVVKVGGDVIASKGMFGGWLLTAMISINLAIMNFLPIPALDGGHVMFLVVEKLTGKKPSVQMGEKITNMFFTLLLILMVVICFNDINALIAGKF